MRRSLAGVVVVAPVPLLLLLHCWTIVRGGGRVVQGEQPELLLLLHCIMMEALWDKSADSRYQTLRS